MTGPQLLRFDASFDQGEILLSRNGENGTTAQGKAAIATCFWTLRPSSSVKSWLSDVLNLRDRGLIHPLEAQDIS